jgi:hypothetical protein
MGCGKIRKNRGKWNIARRRCVIEFVKSGQRKRVEELVYVNGLMIGIKLTDKVDSLFINIIYL